MLDSSLTVHPAGPLLALSLLGLPAARAVPARVEAALVRAPPGAPRSVRATALLLGAPYVHSPLGEGAGPDLDPRFRLDAFDCQTFVETAIALGSASRLDEARLALDDIRYDGPPDFDHRNHYVEAQWIPSNVRKGWIADATTEIAGGAAAWSEKRYTDATWRAAEKAGRTLPELAPGRRPRGRFPIALVPLERLGPVIPRIPEGTLLLVVREDRPWRPYRVTHLGIVVVNAQGGRLLRHASDVPAVQRVRDEPLEKFLERNARYKGWPVSGVSLFTIRDNRSRVAQLAASRPSVASDRR